MNEIKIFQHRIILTFDIYKIHGAVGLPFNKSYKIIEYARSLRILLSDFLDYFEKMN